MCFCLHAGTLICLCWIRPEPWCPSTPPCLTTQRGIGKAASHWRLYWFIDCLTEHLFSPPAGCLIERHIRWLAVNPSSPVVNVLVQWAAVKCDLQVWGRSAVTEFGLLIHTQSEEKDKFVLLNCWFSVKALMEAQVLQQFSSGGDLDSLFQHFIAAHAKALTAEPAASVSHREDSRQCARFSFPAGVLYFMDDWTGSHLRLIPLPTVSKTRETEIETLTLLFVPLILLRVSNRS